MELRFADSATERCFNEEAYAGERWGLDMAARFRYILNFLTCIDTAGDIGRFAFLDARHVHGASGRRWTLRVWGEWRLALESVEDGKALGIMEVYCRDER
jgi:hypothetical protein